MDRLFSRRRVLQLFGVAAVAPLVLPPTLEENAEIGRKIWALGGVENVHVEAITPYVNLFQYNGELHTVNITQMGKVLLMGTRLSDNALVPLRGTVHHVASMKEGGSVLQALM